MDRSTRTSAPLLFVAVVSLGVLLAHAGSFLPFISDDALISLRYADRLLEGNGLTWTDGERVEGYSNLLWVLLCAGLGATGIDLVLAARMLGLAGFATAILAMVRASWRIGAPSWLPAAGAGLAFALSGPVAAWSVGGLEQPLVAALLAPALALMLRALDAEPADRAAPLRAASILFALLCWTRPDGALFSAAACLGLLGAPGPRASNLRAALRLALVPALAWFAQLAFRLVYYGDWVPNSAYAKLGLTLHRLSEGLLYLAGGALWLGAFVAPALVLAALPWIRSAGGAKDENPTEAAAARRVRFLLLPLVVWGTYVALIGGDGFPARRHWIPLLVPLALLLGEGLAALGRRRAGRGSAVLVASAVLLALGATQWFDPQNRRAHAERWEWDGASLGRFLAEAFGERRPLLAVDPAGTLPYFSRLPALDMLGINDRFLAHHRPEDFGQGPLGHELGDGNYVLGREPDLVLFCGPGGGARPCFRSGKQMVGDPRFRASYRLVRFVTPEGFHSRVWVRAEGGRLGVERGPDRIRVPGFLLTANPESTVALGPDGSPLLHVDPATPAGYAALPVPPGTWRLRVDHGGPPPRILVRPAGTRRILARGGAELGFVWPEGAGPALDLQLSAGEAGPTRVRRIDLVRSAERVIN